MKNCRQIKSIKISNLTLEYYLTMFFFYNFLWRIAGSYGQWVVQKTRPDILRKFQEVVEQHSTGDDNLMAQYIHQCNAQSPT